jgi:hypothetical protein
MEINDLRQQFDLLGVQQSKIKSEIAKLQEEKMKSVALSKLNQTRSPRKNSGLKKSILILREMSMLVHCWCIYQA